MRSLTPWLFLAALFAMACPARATQNRVWLASQQDWGAKRGFYLAFENSAEGSTPCPLGTLKLILGVGDGANWRFQSTVAAWEYGRTYAVRAIVSGSEAQLWLDGQMVSHSTGTLSPAQGDLLVGYTPPWAQDRADYWVVPTRVRVVPSGRPPLAFTWPASRPVPQMLFTSQAPRRVENWSSGKAVTVEATFRLERVPTDLRALAPFVDPYGQLRDGQWPGKVTSDAGLRTAMAEEDRRLARWGTPKGYDRYGGSLSAGWHIKPTGYFAVTRHNGQWWLVTPAGNPCFYTGVDTAPSPTWDKTPVSGREYVFAALPPRDGPTATAWGQNAWGGEPGTDYVGLETANLARKYGAGWEQAFQKRTVKRLQAWGFSGLGKWCAGDVMPWLPVLREGNTPLLVRHPDIFDPQVQAKFREALRTQIEPQKTDPLVVGWSLGNEYDGIVTKDEIKHILSKPADVAAKRALVNYGLDTLYGGDIAKAAAAWGVTAATRDALYAASPTVPADDLEKIRRFYADRLYDFIYRTVKSLDPNHLYLGFWISVGWWENEEDWRLIARHCDVLGYDRYNPHFADASLAGLMREANKPVLCGEFSYPVLYQGTRGFGMFEGAWAEDEAEAGRLYARWVADAARSPYCIGVCWFQYRDEPITGRGPGHGPNPVYGEDYAFGLIDVTDSPKWTLVEQVRRVNLGAVSLRQRRQ